MPSQNSGAERVSGPTASRIEELTDNEPMAPTDTEQIFSSTASSFSSIPSLFTSLPEIRDSLITETSESQDATVEQCVPLLAEPENDLNIFGISQLDRARHLRYLKHMLEGPFPSQFVAADASRPWMLYWALTGLYLLGEDVTAYKDRVIATFAPIQNLDGGFGGGHGQLSHVATSYATVLSLVTVGGKDALDMIDRKGMWQWLGRVKQANGGFSMCVGGEIDIRGAYCAMTIICLLNLPIELPPNSPARTNGDETFLTNLENWLSRCQTYEGGIGAAPANEAHGAYAFCGLACLCIIDAPSRIIPRTFHIPSLISCLSSLQHAPESGFAGRTNKLVDGCYSHWVGGCWALISAALPQPGTSKPTLDQGVQEMSLDHQPSDLWSREGLLRYILCACQNFRTGGLRDKPSKHPDSYHSCYVLAGLSAAQNNFEFVDEERFEAVKTTAAFGWRVIGEADVPCEENDRVKPIHPVFVVPFDKAEECRKYFEQREGF